MGEDLHVNGGGRSVVNIDAWNTKRCFQIQKEYPLKKLPYFMSGEKGEKWFPQNGTYMFHNGISLSQAMKTMKLTWNKTITYNRARDGNTNAMGPIQGNGVYLSCKAKGFPTNPNYYYCYCV